MDVTVLQRNIRSVQERVKQAALKVGRDPKEITLVAVTKTIDIETVKEAYALGLKDFGENRVQELVAKHRVLPEARWHLIGRLQTNKVKDALERAFLIHSLDRWHLAEYIEKRAGAKNFVANCLLQVNVSGEASKSGVAVNEVREFLRALSGLQHVKVLGLMTIAPEVDDPEEVRPVFRELRSLFETIKKSSYPNVNMQWLSMGMTQDFEVAIEEGATIIRVGRALFGQREQGG